MKLLAILATCVAVVTTLSLPQNYVPPPSERCLPVCLGLAKKCDKPTCWKNICAPRAGNPCRECDFCRAGSPQPIQTIQPIPREVEARDTTLSHPVPREAELDARVDSKKGVKVSYPMSRACDKEDGDRPAYHKKLCTGRYKEVAGGCSFCKPPYGVGQSGTALSHPVPHEHALDARDKCALVYPLFAKACKDTKDRPACIKQECKKQWYLSSNCSFCKPPRGAKPKPPSVKAREEDDHCHATCYHGFDYEEACKLDQCSNCFFCLPWGSRPAETIGEPPVEEKEVKVEKRGDDYDVHCQPICYLGFIPEACRLPMCSGCGFCKPGHPPADTIGEEKEVEVEVEKRGDGYCWPTCYTDFAPEEACRRPECENCILDCPRSDTPATSTPPYATPPIEDSKVKARDNCPSTCTDADPGFACQQHICMQSCSFCKNIPLSPPTIAARQGEPSGFCPSTCSTEFVPAVACCLPMCSSCDICKDTPRPAKSIAARQEEPSAIAAGGFLCPSTCSTEFSPAVACRLAMRANCDICKDQSPSPPAIAARQETPTADVDTSNVICPSAGSHMIDPILACHRPMCASCKFCLPPPAVEARQQDTDSIATTDVDAEALLCPPVCSHNNPIIACIKPQCANCKFCFPQPPTLQTRQEASTNAEGEASFCHPVCHTTEPNLACQQPRCANCKFCPRPKPIGEPGLAARQHPKKCDPFCLPGRVCQPNECLECAWCPGTKDVEARQEEPKPKVRQEIQGDPGVEMTKCGLWCRPGQLCQADGCSECPFCQGTKVVEARQEMEDQGLGMTKCGLWCRPGPLCQADGCSECPFCQ